MDLKGLIRRFRSGRILVIGDLVLDRYIWGKVSRISPEAPVPVVEVTDDTFKLGGAANVAGNIIALGGKATVAGIVGNDRPGEILTKLLEERGALCMTVTDARPTTMKTRVIAHNQQVVRFDKEDRKRLGKKAAATLTALLPEAMKVHDAVVISDYRKGMISPDLMRSVLKAARRQARPVFVDPKVGHFPLYRGVSLITPNLMEAASGSGVEIRDEASLLKAGSTLMKRLSCEAVLITRGEEGMTLFSKGSVVHIPTTARRVYDVTGAGDTVIATFAIASAAGATLHEAALLSNYAAGIVVGEVGTAVASPQRLLQAVRGR